MLVLCHTLWRGYAYLNSEIPYIASRKNTNKVYLDVVQGKSVHDTSYKSYLQMDA